MAINKHCCRSVTNIDIAVINIDITYSKLETFKATGFVPFDELSAYEKIGKLLTNHHFHVSTLSGYYLKTSQFSDDHVSDGFG